MVTNTCEPVESGSVYESSLDNYGIDPINGASVVCSPYNLDAVICPPDQSEATINRIAVDVDRQIFQNGRPDQVTIDNFVDGDDTVYSYTLAWGDVKKGRMHQPEVKVLGIEERRMIGLEDKDSRIVEGFSGDSALVRFVERVAEENPDLPDWAVATKAFGEALLFADAVILTRGAALVKACGGEAAGAHDGSGVDDAAVMPSEDEGPQSSDMGEGPISDRDMGVDGGPVVDPTDYLTLVSMTPDGDGVNGDSTLCAVSNEDASGNVVVAYFTDGDDVLPGAAPNQYYAYTTADGSTLPVSDSSDPTNDVLDNISLDMTDDGIGICYEADRGGVHQVLYQNLITGDETMISSTPKGTAGQSHSRFCSMDGVAESFIMQTNANLHTDGSPGEPLTENTVLKVGSTGEVLRIAQDTSGPTAMSGNGAVTAHGVDFDEGTHDIHVFDRVGERWLGVTEGDAPFLDEDGGSLCFEAGDQVWAIDDLETTPYAPQQLSVNSSGMSSDENSYFCSLGNLEGIGDIATFVSQGENLGRPEGSIGMHAYARLRGAMETIHLLPAQYIRIAPDGENACVVANDGTHLQTYRFELQEFLEASGYFAD